MLLTQCSFSAQTPLRMRSGFPPFANCAKDGAPHGVADARKSKVWATRPTPTPCLRDSVVNRLPGMP